MVNYGPIQPQGHRLISGRLIYFFLMFPCSFYQYTLISQAQLKLAAVIHR
jgi:hypothetical protein